MDNIIVSSVEELKTCLNSLPTETLFRGQTKHYTTDDGAVSMPTSFSRHGCIPPLQHKWTHYARFVLRVLSGSDGVDLDIHLPQAVLQHYGWRSFFIDASASAEVSAWFASHAFTDSDVFNLCEDCFEESIISVHQEASYVPVDATVFLYALSREYLSDHDIKCFDLTEIDAKDFQPRFHTQSAWLIGPLRDTLPPDCVCACISGPATVFADFASTAGYSKTSDLFPSRKEDFLLKLLLSVPWESVGRDSHMPFFTRGLRLPEYDYTVIKNHPVNVAFFSPFWVADDRGPTDSPLAKAVFFRTPEQLFYGRPTDNSPSRPNVRTVLNKYSSLVIESKGILRHPEFHLKSEYMKGVYIRLVDAETVEVCELVIDHPGSQVAGAGISEGWYYKIDQQQAWTRHRHSDECPCKNNLLHLHHMWIITHFERLLDEGKFIERSRLDYTHEDTTT